MARARMLWSVGASILLLGLARGDEGSCDLSLSKRRHLELSALRRLRENGFTQHFGILKNDVSC
jgi:hypothetical protein